MTHSDTHPAAVTSGEPVASQTDDFVAINYITCSEGYRERFEQLFKSRAHAIDHVAGFKSMLVLRPHRADDSYMVVSFWTDRKSFEGWHASSAFAEGHRRGFGDISAAKARGEQSPMSSRMEGYDVLCR